MYILDVRIDNLSKNTILSCINNFLIGNAFNQIVTINPEFLLEAKKNEEFHDILNNSELNIADGIGIKFAFWRYGKNLKARYTGIDLMLDILKIANEKKLSIFLLANKNGLSTWQETCDVIIKKYPNLNIYGDNINYNIKNFDSKVLNNLFVNMSKTDIIFVNFGAPDQEFFLQRFAKSNPKTKLGVGVGGAFDYITNKVSRAPKFMCKIGFEWFYRLIKQPHRFKRISRAVVVFPIIILLNKRSGQNDK